MEIANRAHAVEPVFEGRKSRRLGEEHQEPVETLVEMRIFLGLKEL